MDSRLVFLRPLGLRLAKTEAKVQTFDLWTSIVPSDPAVPADIQQVLQQLSQPQAQPQAQPQPRRSGVYQDGQYTGPVTDAYYGNVQVEAVIQGGRITDVQFLDFPHDRRTSQWINSQATPWLRQEAIQAQSANVNIISGATLTSEAFIQSLQVALKQARG